MPLTGSLKASRITRPLNISAKKNECVMPRWPSIVSSPMPKRLPNTSRSGANEHPIDNTQKRSGRGRVVYARPKATAATACENDDGMESVILSRIISLHGSLARAEAARRYSLIRKGRFAPLFLFYQSGICNHGLKLGEWYRLSGVDELAVLIKSRI